MYIRTIVVLSIFAQFSGAQSVIDSGCTIDSIITHVIGDASVTNRIDVRQFTPTDCSTLTQRMRMFGPDTDPTVLTGIIQNLSQAAVLYSPERAGPASVRAFEVMLQRRDSGDTLGAVHAGTIAEFLRTVHIRGVRRELSLLADSVRTSIDRGSYTYAAAILDSLEVQSRQYLGGMVFQDSIQTLRRHLSELMRRAELDYALYRQEEEAMIRFTATATITGMYLSEISHINWRMITIAPDMEMSIEGVRLPATLAFPVGLRFGYSLNSSVALESELCYSSDIQKDFRVGDYVSPAGFRRTIVTGEVAVKYRFRTVVGLRPYIAVGLSAAQLERSDFHPPRRFFDATYIGYTIITPPKEFIIPGQKEGITSYIITVGDELLLTSMNGWFSDFFLGTRVTGAKQGLFPGTSYVLGFRAGYAW